MILSEPNQEKETTLGGCPCTIQEIMAVANLEEHPGLKVLWRVLKYYQDLAQHSLCHSQRAVTVEELNEARAKIVAYDTVMMTVMLAKQNAQEFENVSQRGHTR